MGRKRIELAARRGLIRYRREEVSIQLDGEGLAFAVMEVVRDEVELWNEQISLMCNAEGGRLLREFDNPSVQPIYRVQAGPEPERLAVAGGAHGPRGQAPGAARDAVALEPRHHAALEVPGAPAPRGRPARRRIASWRPSPGRR